MNGHKLCMEFGLIACYSIFMYLEDLYRNDLGSCRLYCFNENERHYIPMTFHEYANIACNSTFSDIQDLENIKAISLLGRKSVEASLFWFLSIESFVNTILKYLCFDNSENAQNYISKGLNVRINKVNELLGYDHKSFSKLFQKSRLDEFEEFRNDLMHDRLTDNEKKFKKTFFSPTPYLPNIISEIQALILAIDFFNFYRNCIKGIDFMPDLPLGVTPNFFFEKLDYVYETLFKPTIQFSFKKHNIQTKLSLDCLNVKCDIVYEPKQFVPRTCIKALPEPEFEIEFNQEKTSCFKDLYLSIIKDKAPSGDKFRIPKY